jgi:hypothetical protein
MFIYRIEDKKTGEGYIGKTQESFLKRKKQHLTLLKNNKHYNPYLQNIYNKDPERLEFYVVERGIGTIEELNLKEVGYITEKGELNIHIGGEGGDTISNHPNKKKIFEKRSEKYPQKKGVDNPNFKNLTKKQQELILDEWAKLDIKSLKGIAEKTGISKYLCKRFLIEQGYDIKNRNQVQAEMYKKGLLKGSRNPNFTKDQKEYIKKRYVEDWISCRDIGKELGLKGESAILKVIEELNIKRSQSEWTTYTNLNRKNKNE